jgi:hypothetical protein
MATNFSTGQQNRHQDLLGNGLLILKLKVVSWLLWFIATLFKTRGKLKNILLKPYFFERDSSR